MVVVVEEVEKEEEEEEEETNFYLTCKRDVFGLSEIEILAATNPCNKKRYLKYWQ